MKAKKIISLLLACAAAISLAAPVCADRFYWYNDSELDALHGMEPPAPGYYYDTGPVADWRQLKWDPFEEEKYYSILFEAPGIQKLDFTGIYSSLFTFSEGLAAVGTDSVKSDQYQKRGVGYINTDGEVVIPPNDEWIVFMNYVGYFKNGRAVVLRAFNEDNMEDYPKLHDKTQFEYAYIDREGNYLTDWLVADGVDELIKLPLYNPYNVWMSDDYHALFDHEPYTPAPTTAPTPLPDPELPEYNQNAPSLFASTAEISRFYLEDMNYGGAYVTVTNPEKVTDAGVIAVAATNIDNSSDNWAVCEFIPYEVEAGQSKEYHVGLYNVLNWNVIDVNSHFAYPAQIANSVSAAIITFEDNEDLNAFFESVPYEMNWRDMPDHKYSELHICDSEPGDVWLASIGIPRSPTDNYFVLHPYYDSDGTQNDRTDHGKCVR